MKGLSPLLLLLNILTLDKVVSQLGPCDRTRRVLTAPRGVLSTGPIGANYTQDSHCEWLIKSNSSTERFISLTFRSMGTECAYDYVFVYDGSSFNAPLLGSFSGRTAPPRVTAASGSMLLLLYSDTNYVLDGFRAEYTISACPGNCTGRGYCLKGRCICNDAQWGGPDCSRKLCPNECGKKERHGQCDKGHCICRSGYSGRSCSLPEKSPSDGRWHYLAQTGEGLRPRAAHSAVYVGITDALYVFGGYDLNHVLADLEVYNFQTNSWRDSNGNELIDWELVDRVDPAEAARFIAQQSLEGLGLPQNSLVSNIFYALGDNSSKFLRRQRHSGGLAEEVVVGPRGRYGHSACAAANGFVLYGGKLKDGNLSDELWYYDVQTRLWHLRAQFSADRPPKLTRHTLTCVNNTIYLFGGSTPDGEFSSQLWQIKLHSDFTEQWAEVHARGGKPLDIRVVAHTTVHHRATNSLIVYGGIAAGVARFSKLSDKMFAFQLDNKHWTEIHYTREHLREKFVPRERAFHSANVFGNYLVIFGGYSHRHNKEEICYDNQMYLYHLGCHTWVNPDILGSHNESRYPKQQGVFAHASSVRNDHTLVIVGGYHGNVNGDLLAWTAPPALRSIPPSACSLHVSFGACSADPECGWCSADDRCYGRTVGANCTTNLQTARCPGVCPALQDCHSCLVHGHLHGTEESSSSSASYRLGLGECAWCVQNARCHPKDDPHGAGACGAQEDSPSQIPGWWGPKGTEIRQPQDCAALDHRPGLTFIKYNHPANFSQPDHVTTLNATTIDFNGAAFLPARIDGLGGQVVANLLGFLRLPIGWRETLNICASHSVTTVTLADTLVCNITTVERNCTSRPWPEDLPEGRIPINYQSVKTVGQLYTPHQQSRMELQHSKPEETPKVFTFEYLEPFANGTCSQYTNCLHCLTDSQCGWCELTNTCQARTEDEQETCSLDGDWRYLTIQPGMCPNCSNFISCTSCVATSICEWWIEEARCTRMGQKPGSVIEASECPTPCYLRSGCDSCLDQRGRCVWCQATQKCFSFSVYTSEYQFGLCREWLDQAFPLITTHENSSLAPKSQEQCKACAAHTNCSACLGALSCGWCHDASNPMSGMCVRGDFQRPETSCSEVLGGKEAKWAYAQCPDVDECGLGLHDCHPQADCINTDGSFSCHCRKGYIGDGRSSCVRTCYNVCVHGSCQGEPEYKCSCDVGWYGDDCSRNCGCNNHSACPEGYQICDQCQDHTMGKYCEYCRPGSFGNATTEQGCRPCECNGHGDSDKGECDIETGECFCQDNTEGLHCERCKPNYSGDPRNGQQCYYQCEARGVLTEPKGQGISSLQNLNPPHGGPPIGECLWIIKPDVDYGTPIIQLQINSTQLNVTCGENAVYVYDGLPELVDMGSQSALSAVFCTQEALPTAVVESRTGHLTVHYKQGPPNESFSAVYKVISCDACESPRECRDGKCVCKEGFVGPNCYEEICPRNCSSAAGRGSCDTNYGRCLCNEGWTGQDCSIAETKLQLVFIELFNTERLAVGLDHLRKTLPRFGHSLVSDRRGSLWMFGGYSLSHGPLNDVRLFDTKNISWIQVTVESTPDARMPQGRYFHGADIVHSKQAIFVYGGLTKPQKNLNKRTLNDFWQFDIPNQRWDEIESPYANVKLPSAYWVTDWPPALYGHTLTYYRNADRDESLVLLGGDSPNHGFLNVIWEYSIDKNVWTKIMSKGNGPAGMFGHSTVFHSQTNSLYVFGGYVYEKQMSVMSNSLYRLEYETKTWIELTGGNSGYVPKPRFFHSAVTTDHYMLILGGRIYPWNISDTLYAFSYNCNQWINLMTESVEKIGPHPKQTYAQAMTIEPDGDAAYVIGGWDIDTHTSVLKIELPMDICNLFSTKTTCLRVPGCGYCANKNGDDIVTQICHRNTLDCPLDSTGNTVRISNSGRICEGQYIGGNCSSIKDCGTCGLSPGCVFCNGTDTCVNSIDTECASQICPFRKCVATDCVQCHQLERCEWSYSRRICERTNTTHEAHVLGQCPASCSTYQSCSDCLKIHGCHWSTRLHECLNSASQSVYCAGGTCGLVLESNDPKQCPEPCNAFDQCSSCLRHGNCGWCAAPGDSGRGMCSEGNSERPMKGDCSKVVEEMGSLLEDFVDDQNYTWHYVTCPKENECANGHHSCANGSEICVDLDYGYKCVCGDGYKLGSTGCEPVCPQGCVRGRCVAPSKCECEFGYVGANCSIQCLCHGHSNCEGPDKLDHCIKCHNNTKGDRCEFCEPFFVGDPTNRTACVPCSEYCHGHSNYCVDANSTFSIQRNDYVDVEVLLETLHVGPKGDAVCLRCTDKTTGNRCDECITGNFRGSDVLGDPCRPCDCHGHGTKCHPVTGDQCDCQNNTVSDECSGQGRNSAQPSCWEVQCAKCREGFLGTPTNGRQCYKQMSVDNKMCFNAKPIDECKMPRPLQPGELVFFVIQPRFMNVDIRIVVDVTQGALNVFMSTHDDTYVARPNTTTGINDIELDEIYRPFENGSHRSEDMHIKTEAVGLRTYITVTQPKTILAVRNLTSRLVITLPEEYHKLENTRFFLVLQSIDERQPAYGVVFSRQDQLHIDLFVFFSVFFSVFFLFLAACVVAWKAKQAADARHARRRHVVEMLHMAKRPFAGVTLDLTTKTPTGKRNAHHEVRPVAIEPTGDNVAAVATVFVSLPGGQNLPVKLALASSLILLARQFPTSSRMFLRRRSIHAAPPT